MEKERKFLSYELNSRVNNHMHPSMNTMGKTIETLEQLDQKWGALQLEIYHPTKIESENLLTYLHRKTREQAILVETTTAILIHEKKAEYEKLPEYVQYSIKRLQSHAHDIRRCLDNQPSDALDIHTQVAAFGLMCSGHEGDITNTIASRIIRILRSQNGTNTYTNLKTISLPEYSEI